QEALDVARVQPLAGGEDDEVGAFHGLGLPPRGRAELLAGRRVLDDDELPRLEPERGRREDERLLQGGPGRRGDLPRGVELLGGVAPAQRLGDGLCGNGCHGVDWKQNESRYPRLSKGPAKKPPGQRKPREDG